MNIYRQAWWYFSYGPGRKCRQPTTISVCTLLNVSCCRLDLTTLSSELVEIILRVVPSDDEIKLYCDYEADGKPVEVLADEDKFMLSVSCHCFLLSVCLCCFFVAFLLAWLDIVSILCNLCVCVHEHWPAYFSNVCIPVAGTSGRANLRSAERHETLVLLTGTQLGQRSCSTNHLERTSTTSLIIIH